MAPGSQTVVLLFTDSAFLNACRPIVGLPIRLYSTAKKDRFNSAAYADELFNLTGELQASNKELARATRYFYDNEPKKQTVAIESKPFFTTEDFEKESRMNPDNHGVINILVH